MTDTMTQLRETVKKARDEQARHQDELREIHERAGSRALTPGEQERFDRITRARDKAHERAEEAEAQWSDEMMRAVQNGSVVTVRGDGFGDPLEYTRAGVTYSGSPAFHSGADPWAGDRPSTEAAARDNAMRAIERSHAPDHAKSIATELVRSEKDGPIASRWARATSNPDYLTAFQKLWNDPQRGHLEWTPGERQAHQEVAMVQRAMSLTDNAGGFMVPFSLDPAIILTGAGSINPVRQIARVVQTTTDQWAGVSSAGVTASWDAEAAQVSDDAPTLAQPSVTVHKGSAFIPFSIEVGMDAVGFSMEAAKLLADAKDQLEAVGFVSGSGDGQPKGLITALDGTAAEVAPVTPETFAVADVYALIEALPARWQPNASWQANLSIINKVRQFSTGTGPQHAFVADLTAGQPPTLLGKRLFENSNMDGAWNAAATADNFVLVVGDHSQYIVADRIGTTIELVPHLFGANGRPTGQRGYYMYFRTGADVSTVNAFRVLNIATAA
jgi:HK97 family phage major capsid protein